MVLKGVLPICWSGKLGTRKDISPSFNVSNASKKQNWYVVRRIKSVFPKLTLLLRVWEINFFAKLERRVKQRNSPFKKFFHRLNTAVIMTGNDTFYEKSITQYKVSKAYDLVLLFLKKKRFLFWVWPMGIPFSHKLGQKIVIFRSFGKIFSELLNCD